MVCSYHADHCHSKSTARVRFIHAVSTAYRYILNVFIFFLSDTNAIVSTSVREMIDGKLIQVIKKNNNHNLYIFVLFIIT